MLKISRVSKKGTNHLERVLFMWPALVWERAIMKESKKPHQRWHRVTRKEQKISKSFPGEKWMIEGGMDLDSNPYEKWEGVSRHLIEISIGAEAEISIEAEWSETSAFLNQSHEKRDLSQSCSALNLRKVWELNCFEKKIPMVCEHQNIDPVLAL